MFNTETSIMRCMGGLAPVAFDIETSGMDHDAVITVAGFRGELGSWLALNTGGRTADETVLYRQLCRCAEDPAKLQVVETEQDLLKAVSGYAADRLQTGTYLTAYNGETWSGGFDLPFVRSACLRNDVPWPFDDVAYADTMEAIERVHTGEASDLVGVYDRLVGEESCDPFDDSLQAVERWEDGDWLPVLQHNLADIERTYELATLAGEYVPKSDFSMKNLAPPHQ